MALLIKPIPRTATLVVAAADAYAKSKQQADFVCKGSDDQETIQGALNALPAVGGKVKLTEGSFKISKPTADYNSIVIPENCELEGFGSGTILEAQNQCNIITMGNFTRVANMLLDGKSRTGWQNVPLVLPATKFFMVVENVGVRNSGSDNIAIAGNVCFLRNIRSSNAGSAAGYYGSGIQLDSGAKNVEINNAYVFDCLLGTVVYQGAIYFSTHDGEIGAQNVVFRGCHIYNSYTGFHFAGAGTPAAKPKNIIIDDCIIESQSAAGRSAIEIDTGFGERILLSNIKILSPVGGAIRTNNNDWITLENVYVYNSGITAISLGNGAGSHQKAIGCEVETTINGHGMMIYSPGAQVIGCRVDTATGANMQNFIVQARATLTGCYSKAADNIGIYVNGAVNVQLIGCVTEDSDSYGIFLAGDYGIVQGCKSISEVVGFRWNGSYLTVRNNDFHDSTTPMARVGGACNNIDENIGQNIALIEVHRYVKNTSGAQRVAGDVVSLKAVAAGNEVAVPAAAGEDNVYGMVAETINDNAWGYVQVKGKTTVLKSTNAGGAIAIGDTLCTEIGVRAQLAVAGGQVFARALEACAAADCTIDAFIKSPWD